MAAGSWGRSALLSSLSGAALAILGVMLGLGLPGALALSIAAPAISAIHGVGSAGMFPQDSAWPLAILVTFLMGPLVPAVWLGTRALRLSRWRRTLAVTAGMVLGSGMMALLTYALSVAPLLASAG
ncbi:hypothetical protein EJV46_08895 [Roseococcus sp. SYP-B2431]|uniref:hypothetical protein n=1 Tax=Roseococcus sp. SYP-B2431 TaxID=2496640 RepID=UPI00103CFBF2|nr:hypothetical protein [Roseococcus sp. SYP-B2431]TCH98681.1 hypothetical protein EJV46_08895 [Roseococcus sp. SYP-B2431]